MTRLFGFLLTTTLLAACAGTNDGAHGSDARELDEALARAEASGAPEREAGELALAEGDFARARTHLERHLEAHPDDARAWLHLGIALEALDAPAEAEDAYRRAAADEMPQALNNLGLLLVLQERPADAVPILRRAVAAREDYYAGTLNLAIALEDSGAREEALAQYGRAIELRADAAQPRYSRGMLLLDLGRTDAARLDLRHAVARAGDDIALLVAAGDALFGIEDYEGALAAFEAARATDPGVIVAVELRLVRALARLGRDAEAIAAAERAAEAAPNRAEPPFLLGRLHERAGAIDAARLAYERATRASEGPESVVASAREALARVEALAP